MKSLQHKIRFLVFPIFICAFITTASGQHSEEYHGHLHDRHNYHLGFGVGGTYLPGDEGLAPGFHVHFIRQLGEEQHWGIGLGYEAIVNKNLHSSINLLANYHPFDFLSFNAGPGLVIGKHDGITEILTAFHTEAVFEFNLYGIHIGPMAGFGIDREESHFSLGVHVGFGF